MIHFLLGETLLQMNDTRELSRVIWSLVNSDLAGQQLKAEG